MRNLKTIEGKVKDILEKDEEARNDDMLLYLKVCNTCLKDTGAMPFAEVMLQYRYLGLPSIESVGRTRRKLQAEFPELMQMFREVADIQTADMLKLPVPKVNYHNIKTKPSEIQTEMVANLAKRAEKVRARLVEPNIDNMLNQASTDRIELAKLLNISDLQMSYITNVGAGQGLLKVGSSLVPFVNKFPRNTELYRLMTTKFGEV